MIVRDGFVVAVVEEVKAISAVFAKQALVVIVFFKLFIKLEKGGIFAEELFVFDDLFE